jgi:hypothetical protein
MRRSPIALAVAVFAVGAGTALAHHPAKNATVTIQGFSANKRIGARLPADAVRPGRAYRRHCRNTRLYGFARFVDMRENQPFDVIWTRNGRRLLKTTLRWPAGARETYDLRLASATPLARGTYAVFVWADRKLRGHARVILAC